MDSLRQFVIEFAAATRQYAARQMKWFRKDADFLWIGIDTAHGTGAKPACAREILAWCAMEQSVFQETVVRQRGAENRIRALRSGQGGQGGKKVRLEPDFALTGPDDVDILRFLISTGELNPAHIEDRFPDAASAATAAAPELHDWTALQVRHYPKINLHSQPSF